MTVWKVEEFSLDAIAASGQVFTWQKTCRDGTASWRISSGAKICIATQIKDTVRLLGLNGEDLTTQDARYWYHYLALDNDYPSMLAELRASNLLNNEIYEASHGIRILHQSWWDVAVSFIISQNSNIARIQHTMNELMSLADPVGSTPAPHRLNSLFADQSLIKKLHLGYREPYLHELAARTAAGWQPLTLNRPYVDLSVQMRELESFPGIGPKVASCICLYGLGYLNAIPHDVWIKRAEQKYKISWHPRLGGIQQQYIFAWIRNEQKRK